MRIKTVTRTAYKGAGRCYFTKLAAAKSIAKSLMRDHCECERGDPETGYPGMTCKWHGDDFYKHLNRITKWVLRPRRTK